MTKEQARVFVKDAIPSKSSREINKFISWDDFFHPMGQKNSSRKKK